MNVNSILLTLCAVMLPMPSSAEDNVAACRNIKESVERLKCYDQLFSKATADSQALGKWQLSEDVSGLDKSKIFTASILADKVTTRSSRTEAAALVMRCSEKITSLYVTYATLASNTHGPTPVRYRVGEQAPQSSAWNGSQDYKAYGLWEAKKSIPFIKQMLEAPDFFIRGETESFGTTEASFKLDGIQEAIKPIREACKW